MSTLDIESQRVWAYLHGRLMSALETTECKTIREMRLVAIRTAEAIAIERATEPAEQAKLRNDIYDLYSEVIQDAIEHQAVSRFR